MKPPSHTVKAKVEQLSISNSHLSLACQIQRFIVKLTALSLPSLVSGIHQELVAMCSEVEYLVQYVAVWVFPIVI